MRKLAVVFLGLFLPSAAFAAELTPEAVETASFAETTVPPDEKRIDPALIRLQVLLDRSRFSPGVIDGLPGENVAKAIAAFEKAGGMTPDGRPDAKLLEALLSGDEEPVLTRYTISVTDVDGPFLEELPEKLEDMAKLKRLSFTSPRELLAEKFHMDEDLLVALNPGADFGKTGTEIVVAATAAREQQGKSDQKGAVARIEVDKAQGGLRAFHADGTLIAYYPASIGSEGMPSPTGTHEVRVVAPEPKYYYNPKELNFSGVEAEGLLEIAAGPNNPVGTVWIDLTEPTYGIHGTPEPALVAKTASHGCVRLTNWDAEELSKLVEKGTKVTFLN